jgi:hypothetical protein
MSERRSVLLVEADVKSLDRYGTALERAGFDVMACPGPSAPGFTCVAARTSHCPLAHHADVVVLDPWLDGESSGCGTSGEELIDFYTEQGRSVVLLGSATWVPPYARSPVAALGDRPTPEQVVARVHAAPSASGFVASGE